MTWPLHMLLVHAWHEHLRNMCVSQNGCSTIGRVYWFMCLRLEFSANDRVRQHTNETQSWYYTSWVGLVSS